MKLTVPSSTVIPAQEGLIFHTKKTQLGLAFEEVFTHAIDLGARTNITPKERYKLLMKYLSKTIPKVLTDIIGFTTASFQDMRAFSLNAAIQPMIYNKTITMLLLNGLDGINAAGLINNKDIRSNKPFTEQELTFISTLVKDLRQKFDQDSGKFTDLYIKYKGKNIKIPMGGTVYMTVKLFFIPETRGYCKMSPGEITAIMLHEMGHVLMPLLYGGYMHGVWDTFSGVFISELDKKPPKELITYINTSLDQLKSMDEVTKSKSKSLVVSGLQYLCRLCKNDLDEPKPAQEGVILTLGIRFIIKKIIIPQFMAIINWLFWYNHGSQIKHAETGGGIHTQSKGERKPDQFATSNGYGADFVSGILKLMYGPAKVKKQSILTNAVGAFMSAFYMNRSWTYEYAPERVMSVKRDYIHMLKASSSDEVTQQIIEQITAIERSIMAYYKRTYKNTKYINGRLYQLYKTIIPYANSSTSASNVFDLISDQYNDVLSQYHYWVENFITNSVYVDATKLTQLSKKKPT